MRADRIILAAAVFSLASGSATAEVGDAMLLARIKAHMREELSHVTNYTCLETTARFHKEPGRRAKIRPFDTVRLEVAYANHHEWYGSPYDRNLSQDNPVAFVGSGMIGNGFFEITLNNIFVGEGAIFIWRGEETLAGRTAYRYDFRLPRRFGEITVSLVGGIGTVGEQGSFWVNPQTLDLIRVEAQADEIPPYLPLGEMSLSVDYARTRIGDYGVLLAQDADLRMLKVAGEENYNHLEYTHCRAFSAESAISFDQEPSELPQASPPDSSKTLSATNGIFQAVPALLLVTVQLTTAITDRDAVGALIQGKVLGDVQNKGKIVIPNGAVVRGRIRRLERYEKGGFVVGLEFTEVEAGDGSSLRFYADLLRLGKTTGIRQILSERVLVPSSGGVQSREQKIILPELPRVASFFVRSKTLTVPNGFRKVWRTRGLIR
jgi:hypothetical protein